MELVVGFISMGFLMIINIAAAFYNYGRLSEKLDDVCKRTDVLEDKVFPIATDKIAPIIEKLAEKLGVE
mgnify:CR=1 FL=1